MSTKKLEHFIKYAFQEGNIRELREKSVAVDVSCLLHRFLSKRNKTSQMAGETQSYISYVDKYIQKLLGMECHVVMVFDGRPLPTRKTELRAKEKEQETSDHRRFATTCSEEVVEKTIEFFRKIRNVDVVVAPYEAIAQLAYLMQSKLVDAVVTEDSDLIVFGCEKLYFKWQLATGDCSVYQKSDLKKCFTGELGGKKFDFVKFRRVCILYGSYGKARLTGVTFKIAAEVIFCTSSLDIPEMLKQVKKKLWRDSMKNMIDDAYIKKFIKTEEIIKYQLIFDPKETRQKPLCPYPISEIDFDTDEIDISLDEEPPISKHTGFVSNQRVSVRLALGNKQRNNIIENKYILPKQIPHWSLYAAKYERKGAKNERVAQKNKERFENWAATFANAATLVGVLSLLIGTCGGDHKKIADYFLYGSVCSFVLSVLAQARVCSLCWNHASFANLLAIYGTEVGTVAAFAISIESARSFGIGAAIASIIIFVVYFGWITTLCRKYFTVEEDLDDEND